MKDASFLVSTLQTLTNLKTDGHLTEQEFSAAKAWIFGLAPDVQKEVKTPEHEKEEQLLQQMGNDMWNKICRFGRVLDFPEFHNGAEDDQPYKFANGRWNFMKLEKTIESARALFAHGQLNNLTQDEIKAAETHMCARLTEDGTQPQTAHHKHQQ